MRKRVIGDAVSSVPPGVDLETLAEVEISSEDPAHPIELAFREGDSGWRAGAPGEQIVRLLFRDPIDIRSVDLRFDEAHEARTQEFVLRWSADRGHTYQEIVRQQYTFSPPGTSRQVERYTVGLQQVTAVELRVVPDIRGGAARASLSNLRIR